jgi:hypothetical protein
MLAGLKFKSSVFMIDMINELNEVNYRDTSSIRGKICSSLTIL